MFSLRFKNPLCYLLISGMLMTPCMAGDLSSQLARSTSSITADVYKISKNFTSATQHKNIWNRIKSRFSIHYAEKEPRVQKHIQHFIKNPTLQKEIRSKAAPYLHLIVEEVEKRGLPSEIVLLPYVESSYNPAAVQPRTGAAGLWQIMSETGKWFGLQKEGGYDGRHDLHDSTRAALSHLSYLYKKFNRDWLLALAAYNCGEGNVLKAIQKNKKAGLPTDYWSLPLPQETKDYVPKLLALVSIVKQPERYGYSLPAVPNEPYLAKVKVAPGFDLQQAAKLAEINLKELCRHNAGFKRQVVPHRGPYHLFVPANKASRFKQRLAQIDVNRLPHEYRVQRGDSLSLIAANHKTTIQAIQAANQLKSVTIYPGQQLIIPGHYAVSTKKA